MDFIPTIMMIRHMGYDIFHLKDVRPIIVGQKKVNKVKCRDVYIVGDRAYKIIHSGLPDHFFDAMHCGFYKRMAPILSGVIFDGERAVGYVAHKCTTLSTSRKDITELRINLAREYGKNGYVFNDFHEQNIGKYKDAITILDLESVSNIRKTKDVLYDALMLSYDMLKAIGE